MSDILMAFCVTLAVIYIRRHGGGPARILGNGRDVVGETQRRVGAGMTEGSLASHAGVRCTAMTVRLAAVR